MIPVAQAKQLVIHHTGRNRLVLTPVLNACGNVLGEDLYAPIDSPPFDQSGMDGYAFTWNEDGNKNMLGVIGEIPAGIYPDIKIDKGQAMRIFTGAPLPAGADTVVMQEKTKLYEGKISIEDDQLRKGTNVRLKGSQ